MASLQVGRCLRRAAATSARRQLSTSGLLTAVEEYPGYVEETRTWSNRRRNLFIGVCGGIPNAILLLCSHVVSLSNEYSVPAGTPTPAKAGTASVTALPNGLTVVTENAASTSTVSLTFPGAGSSNEAMGEQGAALLNKCMAWKSGSDVSSLVLLRILEDNGAKPFSSVGRTSATVGYTASPDNAPQLVSLLSTNCDYEKWDLQDAKKSASVLVDDASSNTQVCFHLLEEWYGTMLSIFSCVYSFLFCNIDCIDRTALCCRLWCTNTNGPTIVLRWLFDGEPESVPRSLLRH